MRIVLGEKTTLGIKFGELRNPILKNMDKIEMEIEKIKMSFEIITIIYLFLKIIYMNFEYKTIKALVESAKTSNQRLDNLEKEKRINNS
jgi:hypothetical protein